MKTATIGRSAEEADIKLPDDPQLGSVSRRHADLVYGRNDGEYLLIDRESANGTYIYRKEEWTRIRQATVSQTTPLRFGKYETKLQTLLAQHRPKKAQHQQPEPTPDQGQGASSSNGKAKPHASKQGSEPETGDKSYRPKRDPETGELI